MRFSLEQRRQELPPDSPASAQLKKELQSVQASSPGSITYTSLQPFRASDSRQSNTPSHASFSRCASVTGKLEVGRVCHLISFVTHKEFAFRNKNLQKKYVHSFQVDTFLSQVRLMGCQDLLEDVPGRSRRDKDNLSSPSDLRSVLIKGVTGRSSSKSYSVKDETSRKLAYEKLILEF